MKKLLVTSDKFILKEFVGKKSFKKVDSETYPELYQLDGMSDLFIFIVKDISKSKDSLQDILKTFHIELVFSIGYSLALNPSIDIFKIFRISKFSILPSKMVLWDYSNILPFESDFLDTKEVINYSNESENLLMASTSATISNWKVKDWLNRKFDISLIDRYGSIIVTICNELNIDIIVCRGILVKRTKFNILTRIIDWDKDYSFFELIRAPYKIFPYIFLQYRKRILSQKISQFIERFMSYKT